MFADYVVSLSLSVSHVRLLVLYSLTPFEAKFFFFWYGGFFVSALWEAVKLRFLGAWCV